MSLPRLTRQEAFCAGVLFLIAVLTCAGCSPQEKKKEQAPPVIPVEVMGVELRDISLVLEYVGSLKAQDEVLVYPKVSGKVAEKSKDLGDEVKKGEAICYLDRDEVGLTFARAPVESPRDGLVGKMLVDIGSQVGPQVAVAMVVNMDKVKINLDIPEKYLPKISLGQEAKVSVDAWPQDVFKGTVTKISPVVNLANRAAPVEISLDNPEHLLKSGMYAKVVMEIDARRKVPAIMKEAMIGKDSFAYVYVVQGNLAVSRKITLGIRQGPYYEVKDGLKEGELVVIMGQQRLYDNAPVSIERTAQRGR